MRKIRFNHIEKSMKESLDIYLVCGFNGVGKTTYINQFLKTLKGSVAVIQNELGEVELQFDGADSQCVMGGCVCCTLAAELVGVLQQYVLEGEVDSIVLELPSTAKLSSIVELCHTLERRRGFKFNIHTVDIVDCGRFGSHFRNFGEFYSDQLSFAQKVVLTRLDGLNDKKREFLDSKLSELAPEAELVIA